MQERHWVAEFPQVVHGALQGKHVATSLAVASAS